MLVLDYPDTFPESTALASPGRGGTTCRKKHLTYALEQTAVIYPRSLGRVSVAWRVYGFTVSNIDSWEKPATAALPAFGNSGNPYGCRQSSPRHRPHARLEQVRRDPPSSRKVHRQVVYSMILCCEHQSVCPQSCSSSNKLSVPLTQSHPYD